MSGFDLGTLGFMDFHIEDPNAHALTTTTTTPTPKFKKKYMRRRIVKVVTTTVEEEDDCRSNGGSPCTHNSHCCLGECSSAGFCPTAKQLTSLHRKGKESDENTGAEHSSSQESISKPKPYKYARPASSEVIPYKNLDTYSSSEIPKRLQSPKDSFSPRMAQRPTKYKEPISSEISKGPTEPLSAEVPEISKTPYRSKKFDWPKRPSSTEAEVQNSRFDKPKIRPTSSEWIDHGSVETPKSTEVSRPNMRTATKSKSDFGDFGSFGN